MEVTEPCIGPVGYDPLLGEATHHSPTLVSGEDGDFVLVVTDTYLNVFRQDARTPAPVLKLPLGHGNPQVSSPVVHSVEGSPFLFLLSTKGNLSILRSPLVGADPTQGGDELARAGFDGYGDALWPRFRADNCGSGRPNGPKTCR